MTLLAAADGKLGQVLECEANLKELKSYKKGPKYKLKWAENFPTIL